MTEEQLNELCLEWQKVLRLQDWEIHATTRRAKEMVNADVEGECRWTLSLKEGFIHILDPIDHNPSSVHEPDIEMTLVHELLHIHFAPWDDDTEGGIPVSGEQAIECIAQALVRMKRQNDTPLSGGAAAYSLLPLPDAEEMGKELAPRIGESIKKELEAMVEASLKEKHLFGDAPAVIK